MYQINPLLLTSNETIEEFGNELALDLKMEESNQVTSFSFLILRLQTLIQAIRLSIHSRYFIESSEAAFFDEVWKYTKGYGIFHATKQVLTYPENFMDVNSVYKGSNHFDTLIINLNEGMSINEANQKFENDYYISIGDDDDSPVDDYFSCMSRIISSFNPNELGGNIESIRDEISASCGTPSLLPARIGDLEFDLLRFFLFSEYHLNKGEYEAAFDTLRNRIYNPLAPIGERLKTEYLDNGITLTNSNHLMNWIEDPFNPFYVANNNPSIYLQLTYLKQVEILLEWADQLFSQDTPESINRARELYQLAGEILIKLTRSVDNCNSSPFFNGQTYSVTTVEDALLTYDYRTPVPGTRSVIPSRVAISSNSSSTQNSEVGLWLADDHSFCTPRNPIYEMFQTRIDVNLEKIRTNRNFAGYERNLGYYTSPSNPESIINSTRTDGMFQDDISNVLPPIYRYEFLYEKAKQLGQSAQSLENSMLSSYEKEDEEQYSLLRAKQDLKVNQEQVKLMELREKETRTSSDIAFSQLEKAEGTFQYYQLLLTNGRIKEEIEYLKQLKSIEEKAKKQRRNGYIKGGFKILKGVVTLATTGTGAQDIISGSQDLYNTKLDPTLAFAKSSVYSTEASFKRREEDWGYQKDIALKDIEIGELGIDLAKDRILIANQEKNIASIQLENLNDQIEFLTNGQFTNRSLYHWMAINQRRLYKAQLNRAIVTSLAAQEALAFQQQTDLNYINSSYWAEDKNGLLGVEELLNDLEKMETYRLKNNQRKKELTKIISLANFTPEAFQNFVRTGEMEFETPKNWFDRDFPGHYMRMIRDVSVTVVALTNSEGRLNATLSNNRMSYLVTDPNSGELEVVHRQPESVSLSQTINANGLFQLESDDPLLFPFEGIGVNTVWNLEMAKGANSFDYSTIADVFFKINYTALESRDLRTKVLEEMGQDEDGNIEVSANRVFSLADEFPSDWFFFQNPIQNGIFSVVDSIWTNIHPHSWEKGSFVINLEEFDFLPNESHRKVSKITVLPIFKEGVELREGTPDNLEINVAHVTSDNSSFIIRNSDKTEKNLRPLDYSIRNFNGDSPYGYWGFKMDLNSSRISRKENRFSSMVSGNSIELSDLEDLIFIVEYSAKVHYPK